MTSTRAEPPPDVIWVVASFADQAGEEASAAAACAGASDPQAAWEQVVARRKKVISQGVLKLRQLVAGRQEWMTPAYHVTAAAVKAAADWPEQARAAEVARLENWLARVVADRRLWMVHPYGGAAGRRLAPVVVPVAWVNPERVELVDGATTDALFAWWLAQLWDQQVTRWEADAVGLQWGPRRQMTRVQRRAQDELLLRTIQVRHLDANRIEQLRHAYDAIARATADPGQLLDPITQKQRVVRLRAKLDATLAGADVTWAP